MNEDQASALFAPARERPVPPASFAMADVFAADSRLRRRRRATAVLGTVAVAVLAVVGFFALAGTGNPRAVAPQVTPTPTVQTLASVLDEIVLPPNSTPVAPDPTEKKQSYGSGPGYQQLDKTWSSVLTPLQVIDAIVAHAPKTLPLKATGGGTLGGQPFMEAQYDATETQALDGPHVFLNAQAQSSGPAVLSAHLWETIKPGKTAGEVIPPGVTSVDASVTIFGNDKPIPARLTGLAAERLAEDVNDLWVKLTPEAAGCGGSPASATDFVLTFHSTGPDRTFRTGCDGFYPSPQSTDDPALWKSRALVADLAERLRWALAGADGEPRLLARSATDDVGSAGQPCGHHRPD